LSDGQRAGTAVTRCGYGGSTRGDRQLSRVGVACVCLLGPEGLAALAPSARHLALLAAALVAWRVRNLAASITAALVVMLVAAACR
jgi:hypothetical protein